MTNVRALLALLALTIAVAAPALAAPSPESEFGEDSIAFSTTCRYVLKHKQSAKRSLELAEASLFQLTELNKVLWETKDAHPNKVSHFPLKAHRQLEADGNACVKVLATLTGSKASTLAKSFKKELPRVEPGRQRFLKDANANGYAMKSLPEPVRTKGYTKP